MCGQIVAVRRTAGIRLDLAEGFEPHVGDSFQIFEDFDAQSGAFTEVVFSNPEMAGSFNYDNGTLDITSVSEPTASLLTGILLAGLLGRRRRAPLN